MAEQRIELRVRLTDGSFDTTLEMPTTGKAATRDALVGAWFQLMEKALAVAKETSRG